jgi:hypothetical protein
LTGVSNSGTPGAPSVSDGWISTFLAADGSNPRIDRVVATIYDSALDLSGRYEVGLRVIAGAATAGATLANLNGAAAIPNNSILLANVLIPAASSTITDANIDTRIGVRQHAVLSGSTMKVPSARVYHNAVQSAGNGVWTALAFNSERFDNDSMHDPTTNNSRLTCRTPGIYLLNAHCQFDSTAGGVQRFFHLMLNGATDIAGSGPAASAYANSIGLDDVHFNITTLYELVAGDYVEARIFHDAGAGRNVDSLGNWSPEFSALRIG